MAVNVGKAAEYLVKLGVEVDNGAIAELQKVFDLMNKKSVQLGVALTAVGTALYKFVKSCTEYEFQLVQMAKDQNKLTSEVRASENALKAMGKSMDEIKKDEKLKSIYDDIVKVNKSLSLPNLTRSLNVVRDLQGAWWGLRSSVQYVVQWINAHILANLERPLKKITNALKEIRQWINENMNVISEKVASFMTAFAKALLKVFQIGGKIVKWFNSLPQIVKTITGGITVLFAMIKAGPLGWLLGIVNLIGAAIDDYDNFVENKTEKDRFMAGAYDGFDSDLVGMAPEQRQARYAQITETFDLYEKSGKDVSALSAEQRALYDKYKGSNLYASTALGKIWDPLSDENLDFSDKTEAVVQALTGMLFDAFTEVATWISGTGIPILFGTSGDSGTGDSGESVASGIGSFFGSIATGISTAYADHKDEIDAAWSAVCTAFDALFNRLWNGVWTEEYGPSGKTTGYKGGLKNALLEMLNGFLSMFQDNGILAQGMAAIGEFFTTIWEGAVVDDSTGERSGGLKKLIFGDDGIQGVWQSIQDGLTTAFQGAFVSIAAIMPSWMRKLLGMDTITIKVSDGDGNTTYTSADGQTLTVSDEMSQTMTDFGVTSLHGSENIFGWQRIAGVELPPNKQIDNAAQGNANIGKFRDSYSHHVKNAAEAGNTRDFLYLMTSYMAPNSGYLSAWNTMDAYKNNGFHAPNDYIAVTDAQSTGRQNEYAVSTLDATGAVMTGTVDLSTVDAKGMVTLKNAQGSGTIQVRASDVRLIGTIKGGSDSNAWGGKINSYTYTSVGEEGPEYIIPMTKPARAKSLIKQMLSEMGDSAVSGIMGELGMSGDTATIGGSLISGGSLASSAGITNNYSINAPVTITVNASGADGEKIGRSAYSAAERYLIKNLQGALA